MVIVIPAEQSAPVSHLLRWDIYNQESPTKHLVLWPRFTELQPFTEAAFFNPKKLKASVSRYKPLTRIHRDVEKGSPTVAQLEQS